MKILYVATSRTDAQAVAAALYSVGPTVKVLWATHFDHAAYRIEQNPDVAVIVAETQLDGGSFNTFLANARGRGLKAPVVVLSPDGADHESADLKPGVHTAKGIGDLSAAVARATERAQPDDVSQPRLQLPTEPTLAHGERAREVEQRTPPAVTPAGSSAAAAGPLPVHADVQTLLERARRAPTGDTPATDRLAQWQALDARLADAIRTKSALQAHLADLEVLLRQREESRATEEAAAAEREAKLERLIELESTARVNLEHELLRVKAAVEEMEQRHQSALTAAADQLAEHQAKHEIALTCAAATRDMVDEQLRGAAIEVERARQRHASAVADVEHLRRREAELVSQLFDAAATRQDLEQRLTQAATALEEANEGATRERQLAGAREAELASQLADAVRFREALELRLSEAATALDEADERGTRERQGASAREAELDGTVREERAKRADVEQTLAHAEAVLRELEERHASAMKDAAAALSESQAQFDAELTEVVTARDALDQRARELSAALAVSDEHRASATADVERLTLRGTELASQLADAIQTRQTLEQELTDAATARNTLGQKARELAAALEEAKQKEESATADLERLTRRETDLASQLGDAAAARGTLEQRLTEAATALKEVEERASREWWAAGAREAELASQLADAITIRETTEQRLTETAAALKDAEELAARERQAAEARQVEHASQLADAAATRQTLEQQLTETATARNTLDEQAREQAVALSQALRNHEVASADVERLTIREAELASQLADAAATRQTLEQQLTETATARNTLDEQAREQAVALSQALRNHEVASADVERLTIREAELASQLADAGATRQTLEQQLTETATARNTLDEQALELAIALSQSLRNHEVASADVERLTIREAELGSQLAEAAATRQALEQRLTEAATALKEADERATRERVAATELQTTLEARLAREIGQREALEHDIAETRAAAVEVERQLRDEAVAAAARAREQVSQIEEDITRERRDRASQLDELQERIHRLALERDSLIGEVSTTRERMIAEGQHHVEVQADLERAIERASNEHAAAVATLVASVGERDARIKEQATRHAAALQASEHERAQLQAGMRTTLATRNREIEQLKDKLTATIEELDATRTRRDVLQAEASRVPQLEKRLDDGRAELRRHFDNSPWPLLQCTRNGALMEANRTFEILVGCRKSGELRGAGFAEAVFESPGDLSWLIERCLSTNAKQSVETTWKHRNGSRLFVRLLAAASSPDVIQIAAEDLTNLRALHDRLGNAHRMEAVGRLASEVAVTCGNLLNEIHQDVEQFLATVSSDAATRQRGELVLDEVKRAASFLRQLSVYGDDEISSLSPVDLNKVLRDIEPVLKRVAGDGVELEMPKGTSPIEVDVKPNRVERVLVNLAGYCRERLPYGGRLRIELATMVVDGQFIAKHPNVRLGPHALITVKEIRRAMPDGPLGLRDEPAIPSADMPPKVGVDLGALQALVSECHGHLWMTVEPAGDMIAKIHLPLHASADSKGALTSVLRTSGSLLATRLLQS